MSARDSPQDRTIMSVIVPAALQLDETTGAYIVSDAVTDGGDLGAQVPIFPVVWVRAATPLLMEHRPNPF